MPQKLARHNSHVIGGGIVLLVVESPVQFVKCVSSSPSSAARWFIRWTKAPSLPEICSAIATAQSLADTTAMHFIISRTLIRSPSARYTQLPRKDAARALCGDGVVRESVPPRYPPLSAAASSPSSRSPEGSACAPPFSYSTSPVAFSISTAHGADTLGITPAWRARQAAPRQGEARRQ